MRVFRALLIAFFSFFLLQADPAFAQKSDKPWLKRKWHDMVSRYNAYFHASLRLDEGVESLRSSVKDDFSRVIAFENYGGETEAKSVADQMEEVMKKCSRVIQEHPKNRWEDECFFLIGQSHFFKYDHYAAIETFQFVYGEYPESPVHHRAQVWIMKAYIRQENYNNAESIFSLIKQDKNFPKAYAFELYSTAGDLYAREGKYTLAAEYLEKALPLARKRYQRYRIHFMLGQIYSLTGDYRKSSENFDRVIRLNPPYEFIFQSNINIASLIEKTGKATAKNARKHLKRMLQDDKNIDYFDQIYFELARLEEKSGNDDLAMEYFNRSLRSSKGNKSQLANTYLYMARYFFNLRSYEKAQAYYDSCSFNIDPIHPEYESVMARQGVLSVLGESLNTIRVQDSLIKLAELPLDQIAKVVDNQIRREKAEEEKRKQQKEINDPMPSVPGGFPGQQPGGMPGGGSGGQWYFYNQTAIATGFTDFSRLWGNRDHTDFWRVNSKARALTRPQLGGGDNVEPKEEETEILTYNEETDKEKQEILKDIDKDKQKYYRPIPLSPASKKVANAKVEQAYFKTGQIYQFDLKECAPAVSYYQKLLKRYPETDKGAEATFNLYKCYKENEQDAEANVMADQLARKYPNTTYNDIVNNRDVAVNSSDDKKIEDLYQKLYDAWLEGRFEWVMQQKLEYDKQYAGNPFQARFDYLYALCVAKTKDQAEYIELLKIIIETYPGSPVAKKASATVNLIADREKAAADTLVSVFSANEKEGHAYLLVLDGEVKGEQVQTTFSNHNSKKYPDQALRVKLLLIDRTEAMMVQGFANKSAAERYYVDLLKDIDLFLNLDMKRPQHYFISESNLKVLLGGVSVEEYKSFFEKTYIQ